MNELRWILLLAGLLFLIVLAAWETHRSRRAAAPREPLPRFAHERGHEPAAPADSTPSPIPRPLVPRPPAVRGPARVQTAQPQVSGAAPREPQLGELPEGLVDSPHLDGADAEPISAQRGIPLRELPQMSAERLGSPLAQPPVAVVPRADVAPSEVPPADVPAAVVPPAEAPAAGAVVARPPAAQPPPAEPAARGSADVVRETPPPQTAGGRAAAPIVDWPTEGERHIISVRIVGSAEQRLSGRSTRQALAACGFVHGRYRIFHQPAEDGRALLSCASLSRPGNFDPSSMDFQRFSGLSLFTVLPGPLSAPAALDRLLHTARDLSHRLQARLLDDQGQPLDSARITALRSGAQQLALASRATAADAADTAADAADTGTAANAVDGANGASDAVADDAGPAAASGGPGA